MMHTLTGNYSPNKYAETEWALPSKMKPPSQGQATKHKKNLLSLFQNHTSQVTGETQKNIQITVFKTQSIYINFFVFHLPDKTQFSY